ncbi:MAG: DUF2666 family protein [Candidatus Micrarchaeaceae archaeon]
MEEPEEYIDFMAKYKDWIANETLKINSDTKNEEIALCLFKIKNEIVSKAYNVLGINTNELDNIANSIYNKSSGLEDAIKKIEDKETKRKISDACSVEKLDKVVEDYLLSKILDLSGFLLHMDIKDINKCLIDIKISKK